MFISRNRWPKAITYFYNENENDKVTDELNKLNPEKSSEEVYGMAFFQSCRSLCETEKWTVLLHC